MRKNLLIKVTALIMVLALTGCGNKANNTGSATDTANNVQSESQSKETEETPTGDLSDTDQNDNSLTEDAVKDTGENPTSQDQTDAEAEHEDNQIDQEAVTQEAVEEETKSIAKEEKLSNEQLNSFSMMYYLAITAEKIRTSKDNRLILDDIYTSLLNDINPGAVDEITQDHLRNLRDIIKAYRGITVKRERLQYIYNQEKAAAIRSAVPNPLAILSVTNAFDWKKLAVTVVYTAVDSYNSYKSASENADKAFLMSGWDLDDEETATVQKNRDRAFDYMTDMVQEYHLEGRLTLNEKSIEKFAEICAIESAPEKIRRLVSEEETYKLLGKYWLELADCYFETDKYEKCLECVNKYNELATGIYRKDYDYVQILPKAIVAAQSVYTDEQYVSVLKDYADAIIYNTSTEDWSLRYFVAQVYLDLYARTKDQSYLDSAYKIAYDNVTILLKGQRSLNETYLKDVQEVKVEEPDYKYMDEKEKKEKKKEYEEEQKRVKKYNKALKEERITELPSLYEPLVVNCELLFALADELGISDTEKADIEAILKTSTNGTFMTKPINDAYSFNDSAKQYSISFDKDEISIPADLLTAESKVTVYVTDNNNTETFDDCEIKKVVRKGSSIDTFTANYSSKKLKKYKWTPDSKVTVEIKYNDANEKTITFNYGVVEYEKRVTGDKVVFGEE